MGDLCDIWLVIDAVFLTAVMLLTISVASGAGAVRIENPLLTALVVVMIAVVLPVVYRAVKTCVRIGKCEGG